MGLIVLLITAPSAHAQVTDERDPNYYIQEFLRVVQPELRGPFVRILTERADLNRKPFAGEYFVKFQDQPDPDGSLITAIPSERRRPPVVLFRARFWLGGPPVLERYDGMSTAVETKIDAFREAVRAHPRWTDADANQALIAAGAKYPVGTQKELMAQLPLAQLERLWGKIHVYEPPALEVMTRNHLDDGVEGWAMWALRVKVTRARRAIGTFTVLVDAFEGRIVGVARNIDDEPPPK